MSNETEIKIDFYFLQLYPTGCASFSPRSGTVWRIFCNGFMMQLPPGIHIMRLLELPILLHDSLSG